MEEEEQTIETCVRGYHVYKADWTPVLGEIMNCEREPDNRKDRYAVAVKREGETVGHLPKKYSRIFSLFLRRGGLISCTVTGTRRYSADLSQGGLEIPCLLILQGTKELIQKVNRLITRNH